MIWIGSRPITDSKNQNQLFPHLVVPIHQGKVRITLNSVLSIVAFRIYPVILFHARLTIQRIAMIDKMLNCTSYI